MEKSRWFTKIPWKYILILMKVKLELFGASRDFSNKEYLDLDLEKNSSIKDLRQKVIIYLEKNFTGNENYKKIVETAAFCSEEIISSATITKLQKIKKLVLSLLLEEVNASY